jgi:hypothetical protein
MTIKEHILRRKKEYCLTALLYYGNHSFNMLKPKGSMRSVADILKMFVEAETSILVSVFFVINLRFKL